MFREIRTKEKITDLSKEESKEYLKIKPETNMTYEEAKNFWEGVFTGLELS